MLWGSKRARRFTARVQRKNILRQIHFKTFQHSANMGGATYGDRFATIGAALCYDGKRRIYLCNGYERRFWAVELYIKAANKYKMDKNCACCVPTALVMR